MATTRRATATWSGDLPTGNGHRDRGDDRHLQRPADDLGVADRRAGRRDLARGAPRGRARLVLLDGLLERSSRRPERRRPARRRGRRSAPTSSRPAARSPAPPSSSAASCRARPRRLRGGRRRGQGRLPDLAGAQGQRRDDGRGDARGLTRGATLRRRPAGQAMVSSRRGLSTVIVRISASDTPAARSRGRNDSARYV